MNKARSLESRQKLGYFYSRDSGGRHEQTPAQYVQWAQRESTQMEVPFSGTPEEINGMIRDAVPVSGSIFFDYAVKGNLLSRPALDALIERAIDRKECSHIFIPRRDRLARPDDPFDGGKLESRFLKAGITLVFMDKVLKPGAPNARRELGEILTQVVEYHNAGQFRHDLAEKMIFAQMQLAKQGFSTGGRPPYGFRRWLVGPDATPIRQLADGEIVRMFGHHVVWLPTAEVELAVIARICDELLVKTANQIAHDLTAEGIPSPDAGRSRVDNGVRHAVSGVWHPNTVTNIARNPLLRAIMTYGRRSMGDQLRFTKTGPRQLAAHEHLPENKVKVVQNPAADQILAAARFTPVLADEQSTTLLAVLDARSGSQRGKPRSREPHRNPLGCRVFDMDCGWPMYREPYMKTFRHVCGAYRHKKCHYNHVDGPTAVRFGLSQIRQRLFAPGVIEDLQRYLSQIEDPRPAGGDPEKSLAQKEFALKKLKADLERIEGNMALAENPQQFKAIANQFEKVTEQVARLQDEIAQLKPLQLAESGSNSVGIKEVLTLLEAIKEMAERNNDYQIAKELFELVNLRLFFRFQSADSADEKKRKPSGGVVALGNAPPPITLYKGPTGRRGGQEGRSPRQFEGIADQKEEVTDEPLANCSRGDRS